MAGICSRHPSREQEASCRFIPATVSQLHRCCWVGPASSSVVSALSEGRMLWGFLVLKEGGHNEESISHPAPSRAREDCIPESQASWHLNPIPRRQHQVSRTGAGCYDSDQAVSFLSQLSPWDVTQNGLWSLWSFGLDTWAPTMGQASCLWAPRTEPGRNQEDLLNTLCKSLVRGDPWTVTIMNMLWRKWRVWPESLTGGHELAGRKGKNQRGPC